MKKHYYSKFIGLICMMGLLIPSANSTDGYFSLAYGARHKGLAGAGVALYHVSLINGNPAGHVLLGSQYSVGIQIFMPYREFSVTGNPSGLPGTFGLAPGNYESDNNLFVIPNLSGNWMIGENNAISVAIFGHGGMNTDYPNQVFGDPSSEVTGVNLQQLFTNITYSRKLGEKHSIGITANVVYQTFSAEGLNTFAGFSSDAAKLSGNGTDNSLGFGVKVGYMGQIAEGLTLGAMYNSQIKTGGFNDYAGLFAEQGDFDIPATWTAGLAYQVSEKFTVMADVKQVLYSSIKSVGNPIDPMALPPAFLNPGGDPNNPMDYTPNPNHVPLGADEGSGFGWEDMTIFKLAFEYQANEDWMFRAGYSYGKQPIPETEVLFNILAPGTVENHAAFGFSKSIGESGNMLDFGFHYAFKKAVTGYNPFDFDPVEAANGNLVPNQMIEISLSEIDFDIGFTF